MFTRETSNNHEEWLEKRGHGIGGSDASAVVGLNPYKTNVRLYQEKLGIVKPDEDISTRECVIYGSKAEEHIRALFELDNPKLEITHNPFEILVDTEYPFLRASLDGEILDKDTNKKGVLEIKTTEILASNRLENWKGRVPDNYYCQVLHYLGITQYDFAILVVEMKREYPERGTVITRLAYYFDKKALLGEIEALRQKEIEFWTKYVLTKTEPPLKLQL